MHGGRLLARSLAAQGVRNVFGLCGDHINAIFDGCADEGIRIVDTRHEAAAVHMAEGWSLATGRPGVACVTGGPGLTNSITPLADAKLAGIPLVLITSHIRQDDVGKGHPQDMDQIAVAGPLTVWSQTIRRVEDVPQAIREAIFHARTRRGPVLIEIPLDVQLVKAPQITEFPLGEFRGETEDGVIRQAAELLAGSERPVAIVGEGAFWSGAHGALVRVAEKARLPVFTLRAGRGLLPDDHELCFGPPNFLSGVGQAAFSGADTLVVVGTELDIVLMFGNLAPQAKLIRIDADPERVRRHKEPDIAVVGDEAAALDALADMMEANDRDTWLKELRAAVTDDEPPIGDGLVHPARLVAEVGRALGPRGTIALDAGELALWAYERLPATGPGRLLTSFATPLSTLGAGLPFAIAAKLARPDEPSIALVGDGSFGFSAMELDTAARHGIDVKIVIGNDASWGIVKKQMELGFGRSVAADLVDRRYDQLAGSLGASGERVENGSDLEAALQRLMATLGPAVLDVVLDREPQHPAMPFIAQMFAPDQ